MKIVNPSLLSTAIFINSSQKKILDSLKENTLIQLFFNKLNFLFPNIPIYSNYEFKLESNIEFINEPKELNFLFAVTDKLPPSKSEDKDFDEVFFVYFTGIAPLLSLDLTNQLFERHKKYLAQYSYSENLPKGIIPYFISREFINTLPDQIPGTVQDYLIKNLNHYDTEIFFQEPDLRQYRLDFSLGDLRSLKTVELISALDSKLEYKDLLPKILQNPRIFRVSPSYIELEIYRGCESKCTFCPRQFVSNDADGTYLNKEFMQNFLNQLEKTHPFPLTLCFGGLGEPLLHPEIIDLIKVVVDYPFLKELIIETGLFTEINKLLDGIRELGENRKKISVIVNITTLKESKYKDIYKNETIVKSILERLELLSETLGKENCHVQMIKMKEVEDEIDEYFSYFENIGINVILQKYNSYANLMPEKRVSDLTPIKREFCWHLTRDFYINADATVSICKQNLSQTIGNLKTESFAEIWEKGMNAFSNSLNGNHDKINAPCLKCDEWYTFNA